MEAMIRDIIVDESLEFSDTDSTNSSSDDMDAFLMECENEIDQATDTDNPGNELSPTAPTAPIATSFGSDKRRASI